MASSFLYIGIYIVAFPTIMTIATSYQARLAPYIRDPNNSYVLADAKCLRIPGVILRDGSRVGLQDNMPLCMDNHHPENGLEPGIQDELCDLFFDCE